MAPVVPGVMTHPDDISNTHAILSLIDVIGKPIVRWLSLQLEQFYLEVEGSLEFSATHLKTSL